MNLQDECKELEELCLKDDITSKFLWPNSTFESMNEAQKFIKMRMGATDYEINNPKSRTYKVHKEINKLLKLGKIKNNFSITDITCGDAILLTEIKKIYVNCETYGIDIAKDKISTHKIARQNNVDLYYIFIQDLFRKNFKQKFDIGIMFNSYRGWHNANLKDQDKDLPILADQFFLNNIRFTFLTAPYNKVKDFYKSKDIDIKILGKGEDDSIMFVISKEKITNIFDKLVNFMYLLKLRPKKQIKINIAGIKLRFKV